MVYVVGFIIIIMYDYKYSDDIIKLPYLPDCKMTLI